MTRAEDARPRGDHAAGPLPTQSPRPPRKSVMFPGVSPGRFLRDLYHATTDDDIFNGAAALGFYLTLAIFPAMIVMMAVIPYLPIEHVDQAIMDLLRQALPASAADMFTGVVRQVTSERAAACCRSASRRPVGDVHRHVRDHAAAQHHLRRRRGARLLAGRLMAIGLSLLFIVLVIGAFSLIVLGGGSRTGSARASASARLCSRSSRLPLAHHRPGLLLAFAMIYYLAPNVEQRFAFITPGSVVGVVLLMPPRSASPGTRRTSATTAPPTAASAR